MKTLLKVEHVHTYIGQYHILQGVSFEAREGQVSVLLVEMVQERQRH